MLRVLKALFWGPPTNAPVVPDMAVLAAIVAAQARSSRWAKLRDQTIKANPACAVCGNQHNLVVHHIKPYHLFPDLELEPTNLIVLCEGPVVNCHFLFGHARNWKSYNPEVVKIAAIWRRYLDSARPGKPVIILP